MSSGGVWRIDDVVVPTPVTSWEPQVIGPKLSGLPALNTYYLHTWVWPAGGLDSCDMEAILDKFYEQDATGQLSELATDSYDADSALEVWGVVVYTDFFIQSVSPVRRGLPHYDAPQVLFEIFIG
ncbi:MAG: hypothetical protein ACXAB9_14710 [Candidatus Thorarchaeota archaeon]|jgi:hypothetical protein